MSKNEQAGAIVFEQDKSVELMQFALDAFARLEHERLSRKAKAAWQRRRERLYRASHNEAVIYVRSSHADVLQTQAALLKDKAAQLGLQCTHVFCDSCTGMTDPLTRPGFSKLMNALCATPTVSKIVALDLTRIGRSRTHLSHVNWHLKDLGVKLLFDEV